jgi:hypothetical protein
VTYSEAESMDREDRGWWLKRTLKHLKDQEAAMKRSPKKKG